MVNEGILILPPRLCDAPNLLEFELLNRAYFESSVAPRSSSYYFHDAVLDDIRTALDEREAGRAFRYLIWREKALVGRVNLTRVYRFPTAGAWLGYRIAQSAVGQGVATSAVSLALAKAFTEHGLREVKANCRPENAHSLRVLIKIGFQPLASGDPAKISDGPTCDLLELVRRM